MQILFMDESGTPPADGRSGARYFVLGGVVIPESAWHRIRDNLYGMKIRRKVRGELKWRYFAASNEDSRNPLRNLSQTERDEIRTELYKILCQERDVRIIG